LLMFALLGSGYGPTGRLGLVRMSAERTGEVQPEGGGTAFQS
jgi:hypothetical protein